MRNKICNDPILPSNECDFVMKLQEGTENLHVIFFPFFLRVQLQRIGSPRGCSPPAGQWANLRVPPTIFHCERQGCTLCPDPAKPRLHRRAFFLLFSHSASKGRQSAAHSCIHSLLIHSQGFFLRLNKAPAQLRGCTVGAFSVFFYVLFLLKKKKIIIIINDAAFMASAVKATSFD